MRSNRHRLKALQVKTPFVKVNIREQTTIIVNFPSKYGSVAMTLRASDREKDPKCDVETCKADCVYREGHWTLAGMMGEMCFKICDKHMDKFLEMCAEMNVQIFEQKMLTEFEKKYGK